MAGVISGGGQWAYVLAAYGLTVLLTGAVLWASWRAMTKAEGRSDALRKDRK
ncbi:heme exporter protein CcmD [Sphingopyxis sp. YF1]|jgi:hypothetical protein|uniref:hypothetical protein n=1 Tax=Sphingopyxis sp. YF1 TaxID=2482763 RepID=UPI001F60D6C2|nr:hypothetical protein [Sphingopyxis sp. YF1]UNU43209.1 heme exporter protein CcmD [Sphingopyxis sp. YF1]